MGRVIVVRKLGGRKRWSWCNVDCGECVGLDAVLVCSFWLSLLQCMYLGCSHVSFGRATRVELRSRVLVQYQSHFAHIALIHLPTTTSFKLGHQFSFVT